MTHVLCRMLDQLWPKQYTGLITTHGMLTPAQGLAKHGQQPPEDCAGF